MAASLPPEIIDRIISYITSKATLNNITVSSKQLHDIVTPHLYHCLELREPDLGMKDFPDNYDYFRLKHLTSLFLRKPELASHVRLLSVRPAFSDGPFQENVVKLSIQEARELDVSAEIKAVIKAASHSEEEEAAWIRDVAGIAKNSDGGFGDDPLLAILLLQLRKLERLDLSFPITPQWVPSLFSRIALGEKPFEVLSAFPHLRDVCWAHSDRKYGGYLKGGFFGIPSVRSLFFSRIGNRDENEMVDVTLDQLQMHSSSVEHLEFHDSRLTFAETQAILRVPKTLKTFIYEIGCGFLALCDFSFSVVRAALEPQKHNLENLWLDYPHDGHRWDLSITEDTNPFSSLSDFGSLRRLRIATVFVFGCHKMGEGISTDNTQLLRFLPPHIRNLHLTHCEHEAPGLVLSSVEYLLQRKEDSNAIPELSAITLEISLPAAREHRDALVRLLNLANGLNVMMTVINNHGDRQHEDYDKRFQRNWGLNEDIEWAPCDDDTNTRPVYEAIDPCQIEPPI